MLMIEWPRPSNSVIGKRGFKFDVRRIHGCPGRDVSVPNEELQVIVRARKIERIDNLQISLMTGIVRSAGPVKRRSDP